MFSSGYPSGARRNSATMYNDINATTGIEGASPHKLVSMLYRTVASEIASARGAIARRDVAEKARAISHAVRIVEEGLLAPLDLKGGGALAINLQDVYQYMLYRLTIGNLHTDDVALADCARLAETLSDGWDAIAPGVSAPARAAA